MYEKFGLMAKLSNPVVKSYLRGNRDDCTNTLVEKALCLKLGIEPKDFKIRNRGRKKIGCSKYMPVKVSDPRLVAHIVSQRVDYGICHRHTIESAILEFIKSGVKDA